MSEGRSLYERCGTCQANRGQFVTPGGVIYDDGVWRIEHAIEPIPMVGWLILKPWRHVESMADLTEEEAVAFGSLSRRLMEAMRDVLHPEKIYLCLFAEAEGFAHIHYHFIPRFADTSMDRWGPGAFEFLAEAHRLNQNLASVSDAVSAVDAIRERLAT